MSYETGLHEKDGAWKADAKIAGGVDDLDNSHPLNCTTDGTLEVELTGTSVPVDVIVDNIVPVSQSGIWTVNLTTEPTIDIGKVDQGLPALPSNAWPVISENSLVPNIFDTVIMSPTGTNPTTIIYKTGGLSGTTVATLTLTYDGNNNIQTVTRT